MPKTNTTREVPVVDVLDLVNKSLAGILSERAKIRERQIARKIERMNARRLRRLFHMKPWDRERAERWFNEGDGDFYSPKQDLDFTFGAAEERLTQLKALCETFQTRELIAISADDATLLSNWSKA